MWIAQPPKSRICGQIAVAVLVGAPLEEVIGVVGHRHGTKTRDLVKALAYYGYTAPARARALQTPPEFGICQVRDGRRSGWHWVAIIDRIVYDGNSDGPRPLAFYRRDLRDTGARITSYLPVTLTPEW